MFEELARPHDGTALAGIQAMLAPLRRPHPWPLAVLSLACLAGSACDVSEDVAQPVRTSFELRPGPDSAEFADWLGDDNALRGVIVLEPTRQPADSDAGDDGENEYGERMAGVLALTGSTRSTIRAFGAHYDSGVITLDEGSASVPDHEAELSWKRFELRLEDRSGDGLLSAGAGTFDGELDLFRGHVLTMGDGQLTAEADTRDAEATVCSRGFEFGPVFPYDSLGLCFNKPVRANEVVEELVLLVDGEPTDASVTTNSPENMPDLAGGSPIPLTFRARVEPAAPIPLGSELRVDLAGIRDLSAREVKAPEAVSAAADLGSALANLDFSQDFDRWHRIGAIELREQFEGVEPAAADRFVVMTQRARLLAELDLPEDADSITMTVTGFAESYPEIGGAIYAEVVYADGEEVSYAGSGREHDDGMIECEEGCTSYFYRTEAIPLELDVRDAAGERAFLRVTVHEHTHAATVEDLRLHTSTGGED